MMGVFFFFKFSFFFFGSSCLQELSTALDTEARENKKPRLVLSANVAGLRSIIDKGYEVNKIAP